MATRRPVTCIGTLDRHLNGVAAAQRVQRKGTLQVVDNVSLPNLPHSKGSSVLRMISKYLGEDVFLQGVRNYIKKHAYGSSPKYLEIIRRTEEPLE
jgi:hypothetical protein